MRGAGGVLWPAVAVAVATTYRRTDGYPEDGGRVVILAGRSVWLKLVARFGGKKVTKFWREGAAAIRNPQHASLSIEHASLFSNHSPTAPCSLLIFAILP